ncbi:MAG TPA: lmo0937 family membrane protein [Acidobacteriota bacterium]|nr:lmo0937 family membrane protein [Acidobacteriota bacterium]
MLTTIAILLFIVWLLGVVSSHTISGVLHLLLVLAMIVVLIRARLGSGLRTD